MSEKKEIINEEEYAEIELDLKEIEKDIEELEEDNIVIAEDSEDDEEFSEELEELEEFQEELELERKEFINEMEMDENNKKTQDNYSYDYDTCNDKTSNCNVMALYLKELKEYSILSKEEEEELIRRVKEENDEDAKQKMLLSNLRLVISVAKKSLGQGLPLIDMISEGNIGLIKAIDKFDRTKGYRFSTYAVWWIRQTIKKAIINNGRDIRIPTYKHEKLSKITKIMSEYKLMTGKTPDIEHIANELGETNEKVKVMLGEFQEIVSFNDPIGDNLCFEDIIGDEIDIEDKMYKEQQLEEMDELLYTVLSDREYHVIKYRYGLYDNKAQTLKEIGEILDVTRERVRQIEKKALLKLQEHLKDKI